MQKAAVAHSIEDSSSLPPEDHQTSNVSSIVFNNNRQVVTPITATPKIHSLFQLEKVAKSIDPNIRITTSPKKSPKKKLNAEDSIWLRNKLHLTDKQYAGVQKYTNSVTPLTTVRRTEKRMLSEMLFLDDNGQQDLVKLVQKRIELSKFEFESVIKLTLGGDKG